jgi:exosortase
MWNDWLHDPQYGYGILVPVLVLGLMVRRWEGRPDPRVTNRFGSWMAALIAVASVAVLSLLIPLTQANPEWRPLAGLGAVAVIVLSLDIVFIIGGRPWLRHFAFPLVFFLIAVPWPRNFENWVMGQLMAWNTTATLEILHWAGREAVARGNLILLPCGTLGIEEACSGVRSLQSGLMVALFFGEYFRLRAGRRLLLLLIAVFAALLGNIFRSSFLALVASRNGLAAVEVWHDFAGIMVLVLAVGIVVACAIYLRRKGSVPIRPYPPVLPTWLITSRPRTLVMAVALVMLVLSMIGTEFWFSSHNSKEEVIEWTLRSRSGSNGVEPVIIPEATLRMIFNPEGFSERWITSSGVQGQAFYFRWPAGRMAVQAVSMHNPEVCLHSIGMRMISSLAPLSVQRNGITIPFRSWLFEQNGRPVYVFQAIVEDGGTKDGAAEVIPDTLRGRLHRLRAAKRNAGERMVEVAFWNLPDEASARNEMESYLGEVLSVDPGSRGSAFPGSH